MSHTKQKHTRFKGFTLIELIVVVAIIGILLAVFVPTISAYMRRSRLKSANANAKLIFNSIQTICQEMEFSERGDEFTTFYGGVSSGENKHTSAFTDTDWDNVNDDKITVTPITDGTLIIYSIDGVATANAAWDGSLASPAHTGELTNTLNGTSGGTSTFRSSFMNRMNRLFANNNETAWVAYVDGFQVRAVLCADEATTRYVGAYPVNTTEVFGDVTESALGTEYDSIEAIMDKFESDPAVFSRIYDAFVEEAWSDSANQFKVADDAAEP